VFSPLVAPGTANGLGSLEKVEGLRCADYLAPDGLAVVSSQTVVPITVSSGAAKYPNDVEARLRQAFPRLIYLDADQIALEVGNIRASNVVVVGALSAGLNLPDEAWRKAIEASVKKQYIELNLRAFQAGAKRGQGINAAA
jgi:indolepyruvate ferredoxin oxidoreductase beta subunit